MLSTSTDLLVLLFGIMISPQNACTVTFYQHGDYNGAAYGPFSVGKYSWVPDSMANDEISSLKVSGADDCCVTIYEHGSFEGLQKEYCNKDVSWIGDEFNDKLSSFILEACLVTFYQHGDYNGAAYGPFPVGEYDWVPYSGIENDQISSLKVSGSNDYCCVTVYEHGSFEGISKQYCNEDISWIGDEINDKLSSFKLSNHGEKCSVTFYEHGDYNGMAYGPFNEGVAWVADFNMPNDAVSSLKVSGGDECCVTIYQDGDYQGLSNIYCNVDVSWVGNDWNDKLSSFKL